MDSERFDGLVRSLAQPASRRRTLGVLVGGTLATLVGICGTVLGFVDLFSGGNLRRLTIFALGIMPYITASIILQLLTVVYEPLAKLQKEGEMGRKKITQWTRYLTVLLSAVQSFGVEVPESWSDTVTPVPLGVKFTFPGPSVMSA